MPGQNIFLGTAIVSDNSWVSRGLLRVCQTEPSPAILLAWIFNLTRLSILNE
jgi:hypothetical protein